MRSRRWLATLLTALLIFSTVASDFMVVNAEGTVEETTIEDTTESVVDSGSQEVSLEVVESKEPVAEDEESNTEETTETSADSEESSEDTETEDSIDMDELESDETVEGTDTELVETEVAETEITDVEASVDPEMDKEEKKNMPACDFGTFEVAGMSVTISAPEGAFPEGTTVEVKEVSFPVEKIEGQLEDGKEVVEIKAVDITFYYEGEEIQPEKEISVVFANANLAGEEVSVFHEKNDSVEEIETLSASADGAEIIAASFSVYVVVSTSGEMIDVDKQVNGHPEKKAIVKYAEPNGNQESVKGKEKTRYNGIQYVANGLTGNAKFVQLEGDEHAKVYLSNGDVWVENTKTVLYAKSATVGIPVSYFDVVDIYGNGKDKDKVIGKKVVATLMDGTKEDFAGENNDRNYAFLWVDLSNEQVAVLNLKFDANGGSAKAPETIVTSAGKVETLPNYEGTKDGFVFVGWSTDRNANNGGKYTTPVYPAGSEYTMGDSDVTLYAIWAKEGVATGFFIRLDGKIPFEPQPYPTTQYTDGIFIENAIKVAKFTSCNEGDGVKYNLNTWPNTDQIKAVYENYDPDKQYVLWYVIKHEGDGWHVDGVLLDRDKVNLTYNANAPEGSFANLPLGVQADRGNIINIAGNVPTRNDGYWFTSWNTEKDGTGKKYSPSGQIQMDSDVTLYAQWEKKTPIIITACNLSKTFDGEKIDANDRGDGVSVWSVRGDLAENHELIVNTEVVGFINEVSQTKGLGGYKKHMIESVKVVDTAADNKDVTYVTDRYDIKTIDGNVEILPREIPVTVTCKERVYNGKPIDTKVSFDKSLLVGFDLLEVIVTNPITDVQMNGEEVISVKTETQNTWSRSAMLLDSDDDAVLTDNENYKVTVTQADMKITPAPLKVTTYSASKVYDSSPLTAAGSISGLVGKETVSFVTDGAQTEVGNSKNTYKLTWNGTAKEKNYTVQETIGTLEVKPVEPTTPPTGPTPEPPTGPAPEPTPTPDPTPAETMVVNIADEATPLAAAGDVLGARRGVEADGGSVLGASRVKAVLGARRGAQTADENAMAMYMAMMGVSASFAGLYTIARRKKRSAKNQ